MVQIFAIKKFNKTKPMKDEEVLEKETLKQISVSVHHFKIEETS